MADDRSYNDAEVRAIIDRALKVQPSGALSHADLVSIGAEVGLSPDAIDVAAHELAQATLDVQAVAHVRSRRRRGLAAHAFVFSALHAVLFAINFLTTPGEWWVLFPLFGWGLALLLHAGFVLASSVSPVRLERERRRLQLAGTGLRAPAQRLAAASKPVLRVGQTESQHDEATDPEASAGRASQRS